MNAMRLGLDQLTVAGMSPVDLVALAAEAGCNSVSLSNAQRINPFGFPTWSLVTDPGLRREVSLRLADTGLTLALGEGCVIRPQTDVGDFQSAIDVFCELGAARMSVVSFETDATREAHQLNKLAEMTASSGLPLAVECSVRRSLPDLVSAVSALRPINVGILIDAMHFFRGGATIQDLSQLDPALLVYFQICDVPWRGEGEYLDEAIHRRLPPGEGELPLVSLIAALPADITISMEIPQVALAKSGIPHLDRVRRTAAKCRAAMAAARMDLTSHRGDRGA